MSLTQTSHPLRGNIKRHDTIYELLKSLAVKTCELMFGVTYPSSLVLYQFPLDWCGLRMYVAPVLLRGVMFLHTPRRHHSFRSLGGLR